MYTRCEWRRCNWSDCSCVNANCLCLLKVLRKTGACGIRKWRTHFFDFHFWAERLCEMIDVESMTAESIQSEEEQQTLTHSDLIPDFVLLVELEQQVVDLEILEVGLVEESDLVDPEETLSYCKLALSSEIVDSEFLAGEYSTSIAELDDLFFHTPDNRPCLCHFLPLRPFWSLWFWFWFQLWLWFHVQMDHWPLPFDLVFLRLLISLSEAENCLRMPLILFLLRHFWCWPLPLPFLTKLACSLFIGVFELVDALCLYGRLSSIHLSSLSLSLSRSCFLSFVFFHLPVSSLSFPPIFSCFCLCLSVFLFYLHLQVSIFYYFGLCFWAL